VENLDLVNMAATFDYAGKETGWYQGRPPGEVGLRVSGLDLSESDSDSSKTSIPQFCVCLDAFD